MECNDQNASSHKHESQTENVVQLAENKLSGIQREPERIMGSPPVSHYQPIPQVFPNTSTKYGKQKFNPLTYELYTLFLNNLLHQQIPSEELLKRAGMPVALSPMATNTKFQAQLVSAKDITTRTYDAAARASITNSSPVGPPAREPKINEEDFQILAFHASTESGAGSEMERKAGFSKEYSRGEATCNESQSVVSQAGGVPILDRSSCSQSLCEQSPGGLATRAQLFTLWAKKMYVKVELAKNGKDFQVVSLMSKKSKREIAPIESFEHIIIKVHTNDGKPGDSHLTVTSTIFTIKSQYTFGRRDFGMSEETVRSVIGRCEAEQCRAKTMNLNAVAEESTASSDVLKQQRTLHIPTPIAPAPDIPAFMRDPFYNDIAQVIVSQEQDLLQGGTDIQEEKYVKQRIKAIKRAGSVQYHARMYKMKKLDEEKSGQSSMPCIPPPVSPGQNFMNPIELMPMETAYGCLVSLTRQMRKELLVMYTGERRHYENLSRSLSAAQLIVKRCSALNSRYCNN